MLGKISFEDIVAQQEKDELEINTIISNYFKANPQTPSPNLEEDNDDDDSEDDIVTLDFNRGLIIENKTPELVNSIEKVVEQANGANGSHFEDLICRKILARRIQDLNETEDLLKEIIDETHDIFLSGKEEAKDTIANLFSKERNEIFKVTREDMVSIANQTGDMQRVLKNEFSKWVEHLWKTI